MTVKFLADHTVLNDETENLSDVSKGDGPYLSRIIWEQDFFSQLGVQIK